jgi:hypothetical protein
LKKAGRCRLKAVQTVEHHSHIPTPAWQLPEPLPDSQEVTRKVEDLVIFATTRLLALAGAAEDSMPAQLRSLTELQATWQAFLDLQPGPKHGKPHNTDAAKHRSLFLGITNMY